MRRLFLILFLALSTLNASEVDKASERLGKSKKEYSELLENANLEKQKLLDEYALLQEKLSIAQSEYKKEESALSLDALEDKKAFLEENFSLLNSVSLYAEIFDLDTGLVNEAKLFAFPEKYIPRENMPEQVQAFFSGLSDTLPVDLSEGKFFKAKPKTFVEKFKLAGIWIYPISFFAVISALVAIFKFFEIISVKTLSNTKLEEFSRLLKQGDLQKAKLLSKTFSKQYKSILDELFAESASTKILLEEIAYENILKLGDKLHRGLGFISITASIAPLLGLLGTVTGIIATFSDLAIYGNSNPNLLSSGISQALITTEYGLSLAIPAFIFYAYLSRRAKRALGDMENLAKAFISSTRS